MKNFTLAFISFFFLCNLPAQKISFLKRTFSSGPSPVQGKFQRSTLQKSQRSAAASCGNDTIFYPDFKASGLLPIDLVGKGQGTIGEGLAQWFEAPQPVTVSGFVFFGRAKNSTLTSVNVRLYSAKADSTPNTLLASTTTTLNPVNSNSLAPWQRNINFPAPVTVTGPYLIVVEPPAASTDTIQLVISDIGDGMGERLSKVRVSGTQWLDVNDTYGGLDVDFYAFPVVSYNLSAKFSVSGNLLPNQPVNFTNTSSPIFLSRFYNLAVLLDNNAAESFSWTFGDGSAAVSAINTSHIYTNTGSYNVKLSTAMYGYSLNCLADTTGIVIISNALPVKLKTWEARKKDNEVLLTWSTASEQNSKGFEVQRSADGRNFSTITFVPSKASDGNSSSMLSYQSTDAAPFESNTYYRLKQVDKDERETLSDVLLVKGKETSSLVVLQVYPNPAKSIVNLVLAAGATENVHLIVTNLSGKVVAQSTVPVIAGSNNLPLNVSKLASGAYIIKAILSDGSASFVQKFVKQ